MKVLIPREKIAKRIQGLAEVIAQDYKRREPLLIGVLNGSFVLMADFIRSLHEIGFTQFHVYFIGVASYGSGKESSKTPTITKPLTAVVANRDVIIVEDIVDTGWTLKFLIEEIRKKNPTSIKTLALLSKPARREVEVPIDYLGFILEGNPWVEGYGLDTAGTGRSNPDIVER